MNEKNMMVFHGLVNYGTQAGYFSKALREAGVESVSAAYADAYNRLIDIDISNKYKSKGFLWRRFKRLLFLISIFRKYNVFHFYFGKTLLPNNIDAPFYRLFGKKTVMEYLGTDVDLWLGLNGVDWRGRPVDRIKLVKRVKKQARQFDKQLVCAPVYYEFVDNSIIVPLAIDLSSYSYHPIHYNREKVLTFMHCPSDRKAKKSDYIEAALKQLSKEGYEFNYKCITGVNHSQLIEEYVTSDIVIDQLNHWYGTVSVEAMALGRPVVAGYRPHLCHYDCRFEGLPIINADIYNIYNVLKDILDGKYDLAEIGKQSREFAMRTHDVKSVTKQLIDIYKSI